MHIRIRTFGMAREIIGSEAIIGVEEAATAGRLKSLLTERYPELKTLASFMIAVNDEYATDDTPIGEGDEIAIIPPVSGG